MAKYDALVDALGRASRPRTEMSFAEIDRLVGGLPPSARRHRPWWANHPGQPWARAGWKVDGVDLNAGRVRFWSTGGGGASIDRRAESLLNTETTRDLSQVTGVVRQSDDAPRAERVGLIGCVKSKQGRPALAGDLYTSPLFRGRRSYVERTCDRWFILSALHGVIDPAEMLEPYDETLTTASRSKRRDWARRVLGQLHERLGDMSGHTFEIHAGQTYCDFGLVDGLRRRGASVECPTAGLTQGRQLAFYAAARAGRATT